MTQQLAQPRPPRSDIHDDAVLTLPIPGLPVPRTPGTPPTGLAAPSRRGAAIPHPSGPIPVQPRVPALSRTVIAGIVLGVTALVVLGVVTGVFSAAPPSTTVVHQVTYRVTTAKGARIAATYSRSQHDDLASASVSDVASPWSADAQVSGAMGPTVTASLSPDPHHVERSETISCAIIEDGVQVAAESASGTDAMVTCTKD